MPLSGHELETSLRTAGISAYQLASWCGVTRAVPWRWCQSKRLRARTTNRILDAVFRRLKELEHEKRMGGGKFRRTKADDDRELYLSTPHRYEVEMERHRLEAPDRLCTRFLAQRTVPADPYGISITPVQAFVAEYRHFLEDENLKGNPDAIAEYLTRRYPSSPQGIHGLQLKRSRQMPLPYEPFTDAEIASRLRARLEGWGRSASSPAPDPSLGKIQNRPDVRRWTR